MLLDQSSNTRLSPHDNQKGITSAHKLADVIPFSHCAACSFAHNISKRSPFISSRTGVLFLLPSNRTSFSLSYEGLW